MSIDKNDLRESLHRFIDIVADEAEQNAAFAEKLKGILAAGGETSLLGKRRKLESPGDPFEICQAGGDERLKTWLNGLELEQLKAIVRQHRLDPTRNSDKWKTKERFIELVMERVPARLRQGDSFRHYGDRSREKERVGGDKT